MTVFASIAGLRCAEQSVRAVPATDIRKLFPGDASCVCALWAARQSPGRTDLKLAGKWTTAAWPDLLLVDGHEPVGQRLHEADDRILVRVRQAQAPNFARVHVVGRFRRRPACRTFIDVVRLAARQDVARVVEMHDRLQAREISVVPVGLDEAWIGPLVHIAQCRHLKPRLVAWRQLEPSLIYRGGLAEQISLGEKIADAAIDE